MSPTLLNPAIRPYPWSEFPLECGWYFMFMIYLHLPLFVCGSLLLAFLPRKEPPRLARRVLRFGLFIFLFLVIGSLFSGVWSCTVWGRLYYSTDYVFDFVPFWPITQGVIDARFGDDQGKLIGCTLPQLNLVWLVFSVGTWLTTGILYWLLSRLLGLRRNTLQAAGLIAGLIIFPASLISAAMAWYVVADGRIVRYNSGPFGFFVSLPWHLNQWGKTAIPTQSGSLIWPMWAVLLAWSGFVVLGLVIGCFVLWRIAREERWVLKRPSL